MHLLPPSLWLLVAPQISAEPNRLLAPAIRKMPADPGEKFYYHYYSFDDEQSQQPFPIPAIAARQSFEDRDASILLYNTSAELDLRPAFAPLHDRWTASDDDESAHHAWWLLRRVVAALERRAWSCPGGTDSCISIGYPNSCCPTGETCMVIQDTGLGPVGCCPNGASCGGTISNCAAGNTPCASELGGGCCIPGYVCQGVGCVRSSTAVITPSSSSTTPSTSATPTSTTTTPSTSTTTTASSFSSPPSSSSPTPTPSPTRTTAASAPVRPTSSPSPSSCPTGFYPCLASAGGGCCQTGRDCHTTSCPPPAASTAIIDTDGVTVAVPATGVPASTTAGTCATGWFLCGKEGGRGRPGCCPSGYGCGTASCSLATGGATASVAKAVPGSSGGRKGRVSGRMIGVVVAGVVGLVLV